MAAYVGLTLNEPSKFEIMLQAKMVTLIGGFL